MAVDKDLARRTRVSVLFEGVEITNDVSARIESLTYTDADEDDADDLQIKFNDRSRAWMESWVEKMIKSATTSDDTKGFHIQASIIQENWNGNGKSRVLDCGTFLLDDVTHEGPPYTLTVKGTALPFESQIRQTAKSRAWEQYRLSGIAKEMARKNGLSIMYLPEKDPYYKRVEQYSCTDIAFLQRLCRNAGFSLKATSGMIVIYDKESWEARPAMRTFKKNDGTYIKYKLNAGKAGTNFDGCSVSYTTPEGVVISATAYTDEWNEKQEKKAERSTSSSSSTTKKEDEPVMLRVTHAVNSTGEALEFAKKMLRLNNRYAHTVSFTVPGDVGLLCGQKIHLAGWGSWSGYYIIDQAKHTVGSSGYVTQIDASKTWSAVYYEKDKR